MSPFSFDVLLSLITGPFIAYVSMYIVIVFVAGFSMHIFLRDSIGLPPTACLAGGIAYMFGFWNYTYGLAAPALPLCLWLSGQIILHSGGKKNKWIYTGGLIILIGFLSYNSLLQLVLLLAVIQIIFVIFFTTSASQLFIRLFELAAVWVLGLLLYAPVITTQLVFLPESQRTIWNYSQLAPALPTGLKSLATLYSSIVFGIPLIEGMGNSPGIYGTYFMALIGLPVFITGMLTPRSRKERFLVTGLLAIPLFDLVATMFLHSPLLEQLGFLKSFQLVRVRHFMPFFLAANVGLGFSCLQNIRRDNPTAGVWRKTMWILLLITLLLQSTGVRRQLVLAYADSWFSIFTTLALAGWILAPIYLGIGAGLWIFWVYKGKHLINAPDRKLLLIVLLISMLGERIVFARIERWIDYVALETFEHSFATTPALSFIASQPNSQAYRTISVNQHANKMLFHRFYAADGYQNIYPLRYHELFGLLTAPYLDKDQSRYQYFHYWGNRAYAFGPDLNLALASLMGIRWFYVMGCSLNSAQIVNVFNYKYSSVYENTGVFPHAFVVYRIRDFADRNQLLRGLANATSEELRAQAYMLHDDVPALELSDSNVSCSDSATITRYEPDRVHVEVESSKNGILILTDVNAPGWVCEVNGKETKIISVYNAFRGVPISAGHNRVVFRYLPTYTYVGFGLSLLGVLMTGAWCMILKNAAWRRYFPRRRSAND